MKFKKKQETKTTLLRNEDVKQQWFLFDAEGKTLGRFSAEIAKILRGKHKPDYTPHIDSGDGVIIVNAEKIKVTGKKKAQKVYHYHTGHIGGLREVPYSHMIARKPAYILWHAVKGMMPKSRLGKQQLRKLRIFKGEEHPFRAQKPIKVEI